VRGDGKLVLAARGGFAARGLLYGLIGFLAFQGRSEGPHGALGWVSREAGSPLLIPMGIGFGAYALWRLLDAAFDGDDHGSDTKGVLVRIGGAVIAFIYFGFAFVSLKLSLFHGSGQGGQSAADQGAATALHLPGGPLLLYAAAAAFLGGGIFQFVKSWKLKFLKHVTHRAARNPVVKWIGRIGFASRGCVFVTIAWLFWCAARDLKASEAGGSGEALGSLPPNLRAALGIGLLLFGAFSLVEAWFRDIGDPEVKRTVKKALA
jgi:hypothetical protein